MLTLINIFNKSCALNSQKMGKCKQTQTMHLYKCIPSPCIFSCYYLDALPEWPTWSS